MANRHSSKLIAAVGYARRSTDLQERSIPDQQAYITKWAAEHGYRITKWFIDDAISGTSTKGRNDFDRMIDAAESGCDFETILCYDISRFSRGGTNETGYYLHRLKTAGVKVLFPADGIPEGEEGELLQGVKSWQARQYSVKLSKDVIRGHLSSVQGKSTQGGRAPYGYDTQYLTKDGEVLKSVRRLPDGTKQEFDANGKFVRSLASNEAPGKAKSDIVRYIPGDPQHVEVVKRIFRLYLEGYGYHSIMRQLNDDGIPGPTGRVWRFTSVRDIVTHPVYTGAIVWNRSTAGKIHAVGENGKAETRPNAKRIHRKPKSQWVVIEDVHEPLVSKADFDRAQEILAKRRKQGGAAKPNRRYLLSGLMRCQRCGYTFLGRPLGNKKKRYRYYVDGGHHRGGKAICPHRQIPADALEQWVIGQVKSVIQGETATIEAATKKFLKALRSQAKPTKSAKSLAQELSAINKRIQGLAAMLADPNLGDLEEIHQTLVDLKKRRDALDKKRHQNTGVAHLDVSEAAVRKWVAEKIETLEDVLANPDASPAARNLMAAFVDRIEIAKEGKRGTLYLITNPAAAFARETSTRVLVGEACEMLATP